MQEVSRHSAFASWASVGSWGVCGAIHEATRGWAMTGVRRKVQTWGLGDVSHHSLPVASPHEDTIRTVSNIGVGKNIPLWPLF